MQLQWLYYFAAIAELEHYTKAAYRLHVSQSNLSHAMRDLEKELGTKLFEPQGRNIRLTKAGELFLPYVLRTLNTLESGVNTVKEYTNPNTGSINLAGFYSIEAFTTDLMVRYRSETNRLGIQFQYGSEGWYDLRKNLLEGKADLIFCTKINEPQIGSSYIGTHPLVALVPERHPLAGRKRLKLEDFQGRDFVSFNKAGQIRNLLDRVFQDRGIQVNVVMESPNDVILYGVVAAGHGMAIVPYPIQGVPFGTKVIPLEDGISERKVYLQWNEGRYTVPAVEYFKNYVIRSGDVLNQYFQRKGLVFSGTE
ncbi:LysR family transcriptional regulator [Acidaminococcus timonensis]|uniref:LysR family transcriptional regulator n=1 Tax=Acidaminococcus timonensis TaxID=1871002 RepID=UPI00307C602A